MVQLLGTLVMVAGSLALFTVALVPLALAQWGADELLGEDRRR